MVWPVIATICVTVAPASDSSVTAVPPQVSELDMRPLLCRGHLVEGTGVEAGRNHVVMPGFRQSLVVPLRVPGAAIGPGQDERPRPGRGVQHLAQGGGAGDPHRLLRLALA